MTNFTMKELPDSERPYEKCLLYGAGSLSDAQLLAVIIRSGTAGKTCTDLACDILNSGPDGLLNLVYMTVEELETIPGIGSKKAIQLKCAVELARRIANLSRHESVSLNNARSIAAYFMEDLRHKRKEHFLVACFDCKCRLLGSETLSVGTSTASLVSPSEIFRAAISVNAAFIVLLHNHPSGDPTPSREDELITQRIRSCGEFMGIALSDHIIIGDNCFYSFYQNEKEI